MIPFGLTTPQFAARYQKAILLSEGACIQLVRELISLTVPEDVATAKVEIFLDDEGGAPDFWIYFSGKNNRVNSEEKSIFPGRALRIELDLSSLTEFDKRYFTSEFQGNTVAAGILKKWFSECWWKAGGWSYAVPTTLAVHDGLDGSGIIKLTEQ